MPEKEEGKEASVQPLFGQPNPIFSFNPFAGKSSILAAPQNLPPANVFLESMTPTKPLDAPITNFPSFFDCLKPSQIAYPI
jgi:hypothetical protein